MYYIAYLSDITVTIQVVLLHLLFHILGRNLRADALELLQVKESVTVGVGLLDDLLLTMLDVRSVDKQATICISYREQIGVIDDVFIHLSLLPHTSLHHGLGHFGIGRVHVRGRDLAIGGPGRDEYKNGTLYIVSIL